MNEWFKLASNTPARNRAAPLMENLNKKEEILFELTPIEIPNFTEIMSEIDSHMEEVRRDFIVKERNSEISSSKCHVK